MKDMIFKLDEIINICEYVRQGSKDSPSVKTKKLVYEYLSVKQEQKDIDVNDLKNAK